MYPGQVVAARVTADMSDLTPLVDEYDKVTRACAFVLFAGLLPVSMRSLGCFLLGVAWIGFVAALGR